MTSGPLSLHTAASRLFFEERYQLGIRYLSIEVVGKSLSGKPRISDRSTTSTSAQFIVDDMPQRQSLSAPDVILAKAFKATLYTSSYLFKTPKHYVESTDTRESDRYLDEPGRGDNTQGPLKHHPQQNRPLYSEAVQNKMHQNLTRKRRYGGSPWRQLQPRQFATTKYRHQAPVRPYTPK